MRPLAEALEKRELLAVRVTTPSAANNWTLTLEGDAGSNYIH